MTVNELKKYLRGLPPEAELFFELWTGDPGYKRYYLKAANGIVRTDKLTGGPAVCVGVADNCSADQIEVKEFD